MSDLKAAFDNLIDELGKTVDKNIAKLESTADALLEKAKENRLTQLEKDLAELNNRKVQAQKDAMKGFNPTSE